MRFVSSRWLKIGISLGLLSILFYSVDVVQFTQQVRAARLDYIVVAFLGYLLGQSLCAYKWRLLARPLGFTQPLHTFLLYYFAGMYFNLFAPSMVVGDVGRGFLLARGTPRLRAALQSVLADRVCGLVMLVWVSAGSFLLFGPSVLPVELYYGTIATAGGSVLAWWGLPWLIERTGAPHNVVRRFVERLIVPYRSDVFLVSSACGISIVFHLFQLGLQGLVAAAVGLSIPFWYLLLFIPVVQILSTLPISFGGLGLREGGYIISLALWGIERDEALAFGLVWSAIVLGANLCGGMVLLTAAEIRFSMRDLKKTLGG